jgi:hypothetical protein
VRTVSPVSRRNTLRSLLTVLIVLLPAAPVFAHEEDDSVVWGEDPADIVVTEDCSVMQRNFVSTYVLDHRLEQDLAARATRMELESADGVVTGFTIASPGWRAHTEQPESRAHAERRTPANTEAGLLLRIGLEHRTAGTSDSIVVTLRVYMTQGPDPESLPLTARRLAETLDPSSVELFRQWCHEPVLVTEDGYSAEKAAQRDTFEPAPLLSAAQRFALLGLGILSVAAVLWLRRPRR